MLKILGLYIGDSAVGSGTQNWFVAFVTRGREVFTKCDFSFTTSMFSYLTSIGLKTEILVLIHPIEPTFMMS